MSRLSQVAVATILTLTGLYLTIASSRAMPLPDLAATASAADSMGRSHSMIYFDATAPAPADMH